MAKDTGKKLADMLYGADPEQAAFGVYPQLKPKRSKQDREAAKNVPVDLVRGAVSGVLGAPGDVESIFRLLPGVDEKTILPTSEDIEKRLPFKSDTPVSRAATGVGQLGGGFYTGPGSPFKLVGSIPAAVKHGAQEFAKASAGSASHVIKPKGGNWLTGSVEKGLQGLKRRDVGDDFRLADELGIGDLARQDAALNNWVDRNLGNYVKKEMATPEDPVRKLAEEGITHLPANDIDYVNQWIPEHLAVNRMKAGFPSEGMGKSNTARGWETLTDNYISSSPAREYTKPLTESEARRGLKSVVEDNPWLTKLDPETPVSYLDSPGSMKEELGFDHILDVLREDIASGRIRPEQLSKVSMEQAVRRTYEYDQEMARKMREAAIKQTEGMPVHKEYPEGYKWIELNLSPEQKELAKEYETKYMSEVGKRVGEHPGDNGRIPADEIKKQVAKEMGENPYETLKSALKYEGDTMGHCVGGYCPDVLEGRSRIYSLRDAKGEPHVTVEVQPSTRNSKHRTDWFANQPEDVQNKITKEALELEKTYGTGQEYGSRDNWQKAFFNVIDSNMGPETPSIVQIKGKQNRAPKEDYLPFVQDFVRSGKWSDVGDIQNTGMRATKDIFNKSEIEKLRELGEAELPHAMTGEDIQRYHNMIVPEGQRLKYDAKGNVVGLEGAEGFADGGPVYLADNPDTMELELAGGGLVKGLVKAAKGVQDVLPAAEREANRAKFLEASKIKDRVYHGSGADIQDFKPSKTGALGPGVYVTSVPKEASEYAFVRNYNRPEEQPNVLPLHIQAENPFHISSVNNSGSQFFLHFDPKGKLSDDEVVELAKKAGYDSVHADLEGVTNIFDPRKIKSATGNRGTYDINDPDITKAEGGEVHMAGGGVHFDEGGAAFGQYTTGKKYQAAKKRAEDADVNLLPDPKTYAVVQGLLGTAPDELGFSAAHPKAQAIKDVAEPAFYLGTALNVAPLAKALKAPAMAAGRAGERLAERAVPSIMERGGLGSEALGALAQASRSYAYRPTTPLKPDPDVGTRYKKQYVGGLAPRQDLNIEDLEKSSAKIFPWDATSRNQLVTEVSEIPLTKPVLTEGGDEYMMDLEHIKKRIAGASNEGIAKRIKDRIDQAAVENQLLGGTGKVYGFPIRMGDFAENAATFPTDIAMDLLKQGKLKKSEMKDLDASLRNMVFEGKKGVFSDMAPIGTPEFEQQLRTGLKSDKKKEISGFTPMNLRKGLMDRLGMVGYQKRLGYNLPDLTGAVLSDELKGVPKGYVGNVAAELDPFTEIRPSKSSAYSHDFSGQYAGSMPNMPVELLMPNTFESIYREMKIMYPNAKPDALRNMTIGAMEKRKEKISEMIGPRTVDAVKTYQEGLMKGEFDPNDIKQVYDYMRRKKLQLKLADGGSVGYTQGGEITADDLILEERKL